MRTKASGVHFVRGIALQISVLGWVVALLTLIVFGAGVIPQQKLDLQDALRSKAQGIASSLQEVTAGAAVSEDYSSVVEQCTQVLAGDDAIDYLVITKNDGFSVIVERKGWRTAQLGNFWRPRDRKATSGIETVPDFNRRVFRFASPFDYSAIQWGWINVGLSLKSYDQSVKNVYWRTGDLSVLCGVLSLLVSVTYARRQVRPILSLQSTVRQVAEGNLLARATIRSGDEIQDLASSFNSMTASVLQRNQILESVRIAAQELLVAPDLRTVIDAVLARMGAAAQATNVWVTGNGSGPKHGEIFDLRYEWTSQTVAATPDAPVQAAGDPAREKSARPAIAASNSLLAIPILVNDECIGYLGVDDCTQPRVWSSAEQDCFRAMGGMIGASITRWEALRGLQEAKDLLEHRVADRTRELQEEIHAKDRAHRELAEAQQNLMRLSRLSGMAEVATSVLHNVGNVLNSVNVSTTLVSEKMQALKVDNFTATVAMLNQHEADIAAFLAHDPKGSRILPYLTKLEKQFQEERQTMLVELEQLRSHVEHIKGIVATQQSYAKVSGLVEDVCLENLVDDACRILQTGFERHKIIIERDFADVPPFSTEKHAVLQILLNLIRNAKDAIKLADHSERRIHIRIQPHGGQFVRLQVIDSGVGIAPEDLTRIFSHGFTTKPGGHGFGLHSSALDARKLGGSLSAASDGPGRGATFTLELPLRTELKRSVA
jgi:two-component system NtrC family sensor kinase